MAETRGAGRTDSKEDVEGLGEKTIEGESCSYEATCWGRMITLWSRPSRVTRRRLGRAPGVGYHRGRGRLTLATRSTLNESLTGLTTLSRMPVPELLEFAMCAAGVLST